MRMPQDELHDRVGLIEVVNRVLDKGVAVTGEVVIGVGGVDLIFLGLQLVLSSVETLDRLESLRPLSRGPEGTRAQPRRLHPSGPRAAADPSGDG